MDGGRRNLQAFDDDEDEEEEVGLGEDEELDGDELDKEDEEEEIQEGPTRSLMDCVNDIEPIKKLQLRSLETKWYPQSMLVLHEDFKGMAARRVDKDDLYCPELEIGLRRKSSSPARDGSGKMVRNDVMRATMSFQGSPGAHQGRTSIVFLD